METDGGHDVLVAGEALVDFVPEQSGSLAAVESFTRRAGGAPANVAAALAALDRPPLFWTRVGDDAFGDHVVATLSERGVPLDLVERDQHAKTALAFVPSEDDDSFTFYRDGTADTRIEPGTVPDETLAALEWVHVGGVTLADEPARTATYELATRAPAAECTVSFDPNARSELWDEFDFADSVEGMLRLVDVVTATPGDLWTAGIEAADPLECARAVAERGPHTVFVTLGASGAVVHATEEAPWGDSEGSLDVHHDGYEVDPVDATGAGDAFTAGVIAALSDGRTLEAALAFANAVGALATTATGAMAALPDRESVRAFRAERE